MSTLNKKYPLNFNFVINTYYNLLSKLYSLVLYLFFSALKMPPAHLADEAALVPAPGEGVVEGPVPRPQGRRVRADGAAAQPDRAAEVRVARS